MSALRRTVALVALVALCLVSHRVSASDDADRTGSPYFVVKGAAPGLDELPLKKTSAEVDIAGIIANVRVTQEYRNEGETALEAVYVFPASTRAAVHAMRMRVGDRLIEARIRSKDAARKQYETAREKGKTASLLEQKRPNVFQMNVANILPGDIIRVELDYVEQLVPESGVYSFVYPTVVGPRYTGETEDGDSEEWTATPYTTEGVDASYQWDLSARIRAGMKIAGIKSDTHPITASFSGPEKAMIEVDDDQGGNRDFVLEYELRGAGPRTGLLLHQGDKENFFLAMVQPPKKLPGQKIPPREYVFILDVSGSMSGFPLETAKEVMRNLFSGLRETDTFNVMTFSGGNAVMSPWSIDASEDNIEKAISFVDTRSAGGGTRILEALQSALAMPRADDVSTSFVVVTDGYVSVDDQVFKLVRERLDQANLFAFGIGSSPNRNLIEGMARAGMGEPFFVTSSDHAKETSARFVRYLSAPALTNMKVAFKGFDAYDVIPAKIPDLFAERPILVFGKYRGKAEGTIAVTGTHGDGNYARSIDVSKSRGQSGNRALRHLWARQKVAEHMDHYSLFRKPETENAVTALGLRYNLMTRFTSFVAIDKKIRNPSGNLKSVKQALPLPKGVSNLAIGQPTTVSRPHMPPGDPVLSVLAPADTLGVTAYFPFGLVKDLELSSDTGRWTTRFLVPNTVADGEYDVVLLVEGPMGVERRTIVYTIDSAAPDLRVELTQVGDERVLVLTSNEPLRAASVLLGGERLPLEISEDGLRAQIAVELDSGTHELRLSAFDLARNQRALTWQAVVP